MKNGEKIKEELEVDSFGFKLFHFLLKEIFDSWIKRMIS
jgi:hypothetical protein